jgi:CheY-like chemotaxis protein
MNMQEASVLPTGRPLKILVVEDDTLTRVTLCKLFQRMNFETCEACNGHMAIKQMHQENPDIIITDLLMPDKEGLETISDIRRENREIKIVAMSGGGHTHNMSFLDIAKELGANYTLAKPFRPAEILDLIKKLSTPEA